MKINGLYREMNKNIKYAIDRASGNKPSTTTRGTGYCCNGNAFVDIEECGSLGRWSNPVNYYDCPCVPADQTCCCENRFISSTWGYQIFWDGLYGSSFNLGDECPFTGCCGGTCEGDWGNTCSQCVHPGIPGHQNQCYVYGGEWATNEEYINPDNVARLQACGISLPPDSYRYCPDSVAGGGCTNPWSDNCMTQCEEVCAEGVDNGGVPCMAYGSQTYCMDDGQCYCNCGPAWGALGRTNLPGSEQDSPMCITADIGSQLWCDYGCCHPGTNYAQNCGSNGIGGPWNWCIGASNCNCTEICDPSGCGCNDGTIMC